MIFGGSLVSFWRLYARILEEVLYKTLLVCGTGQTVWRIYVRYVAVPCGFARPWWDVRLRGAVPLGSAKHAGVNAACRW